MSESPALSRDTPLIVEERLRVSIACLACLRSIARLAVEPCDVPLVVDVTRFARLTRQFSRAVESHLRAIELALPVSATNLDTPSPEERV
jgi:hypothetical protein